MTKMKTKMMCRRCAEPRCHVRSHAKSRGAFPVREFNRLNRPNSARWVWFALDPKAGSAQLHN